MSTCRSTPVWSAHLLAAVALVAVGCQRDANTVPAPLLVIQLPLSLLATAFVCVACLLSGAAIGFACALYFVRLADSVAAKHHRAALAQVLGASGSVHASVQEVLAIVHRRTQELQRLVAVLQKGGAK